MYTNRILSVENLESFDFEATKRNVVDYFLDLEKLEWQFAKINAQKGITANYDFANEYQKQPYTPFGKDNFSLAFKEHKEDELKKYISSYYWAVSVLSEDEKNYIKESFINHKYQDELADLFGFNSCDNHVFRRLRKSAIYKFADFLNLLVRNKEA